MTLNCRRRKSSPDFTVPIIVQSDSNAKLLEDKEALDWMKPQKEALDKLFHRQAAERLLTSEAPSPTYTSHTSIPQFLRSFSSRPNISSAQSSSSLSLPPPPPLSQTTSSSSSYYTLTPYSSSPITLPAPPILNSSSVASLKKKKRLLRASIASSSGSSIFDYPITPPISTETKTMLWEPEYRKSTCSDIELATEIGQGLLTEVRKMQAALQEKQETLAHLEFERSENQQLIDELSKQLRFKNDAEDKLKEDIWNLELTNQDLSHQIIKLSQTITKLQLDKTKFRRENSLIQQELENLKSSQENFKENLQKSQQEHEEILAKLKKRLEHIQKEKEKMNNQLKQHIKEASVKTEQEASIELIKKEVIVSSEEITSLRFSLEQAHKVIKGLQVALDEEKTKKDEIEKLLYESQETIEEIQHCTTPLDSNIGSPHWPLDISTVRDDTNISSQSSLSQPLIPDDDNSSSTSHSNTASSWKTDRRPTLNDEILNVENARLLENSKRCVNQNNLNHYGSFYKENAHRTSEEGGFKMITNEKEENLNSTNITCNIEENPNHPFSDINENDFNKVDLPAIMQTMIGEWLYKYVRNRVGQGISANYHRRFFWLHPYTRILYWCTQEPGTEGEWKAKSASILSYRVEKNQNGELPAIIIKTTNRDIKIKCTNRRSHKIWVQSLEYLLKEKTPKGNTANNRLSLLLETAPPATVKGTISKQKWRCSMLSQTTTDDSSRFTSFGFSTLKKRSIIS